MPVVAMLGVAMLGVAMLGVATLARSAVASAVTASRRKTRGIRTLLSLESLVVSVMATRLTNRPDTGPPLR